LSRYGGVWDVNCAGIAAGYWPTEVGRPLTVHLFDPKYVKVTVKCWSPSDVVSVTPQRRAGHLADEHLMIADIKANTRVRRESCQYRFHRWLLRLRD